MILKKVRGALYLSEKEIESLPPHGDLKRRSARHAKIRKVLLEEDSNRSLTLRVKELVSISTATGDPHNGWRARRSF
jgi:hypothetical protein